MNRDELLPGTLTLLVLKTLERGGEMHGYEIARSIQQISQEVLQVEEGSLYPALQRMLVKGWVKAEWGVSETNRKVRFYQITAAGRKHLAAEVKDYERLTSAIRGILRAS